MLKQFNQSRTMIKKNTVIKSLCGIILIKKIKFIVIHQEYRRSQTLLSIRNRVLQSSDESVLHKGKIN